MRALIRNCSHGSEICLVENLSQAGLPISIGKSSSFPNGILNLRQEIEGFLWYSKRIDQPVYVNIVSERAQYLSISYDFITGKKVSYRNGYFSNRKWIAYLLEHYCSVWGVERDTQKWHVLHGDMSLNNVIFTDKGPVILDWEHFKENAAPLGFDGLHLLFESLWFESGNEVPLRKSLTHLAEMICIMKERKCLGKEFHGPVFSSFINFINNNSSLWGAQLSTFRGKLPVLMFSGQCIDSIDKELERLINF